MARIVSHIEFTLFDGRVDMVSVKNIVFTSNGIYDVGIVAPADGELIIAVFKCVEKGKWLHCTRIRDYRRRINKSQLDKIIEAFRKIIDKKVKK